MIVQTPSHVISPGLSPVRPPGVLLSFPVNFPERVDKANIVIELIEPLTFLRQEAGVLLIRLPVLQIDFLVTNIPIAADYVFPVLLS